MSESGGARGAVPLVQPIAVDGAGCHWASVQAVAAAAALVYRQVDQDPLVAEWLASGAGKSVRRAKAGALDKLAGLGLVQCEVRVGTARAVAFAPMTYEAMPKALGRLQVAGTDLPREEPGPWRPQDQTGVELVVTVDRAGHMSTGKLAAQVAHVVVGWAGLHRSFEPNPRRFVVVPVPRSALVSAAAEEDTVAVHDAGHTEVAPGTLTAVGVSCADPVSAPALPRG